MAAMGLRALVAMLSIARVATAQAPDLTRARAALTLHNNDEARRLAVEILRATLSREAWLIVGVTSCGTKDEARARAHVDRVGQHAIGVVCDGRCTRAGIEKAWPDLSWRERGIVADACNYSAPARALTGVGVAELPRSAACVHPVRPIDRAWCALRDAIPEPPAATEMRCPDEVRQNALRLGADAKEFCDVYLEQLELSRANVATARLRARFAASLLRVDANVARASDGVDEEMAKMKCEAAVAVDIVPHLIVAICEVRRAAWSVKCPTVVEREEGPPGCGEFRAALVDGIGAILDAEFRH